MHKYLIHEVIDFTSILGTSVHDKLNIIETNDLDAYLQQVKQSKHIIITDIKVTKNHTLMKGYLEEGDCPNYTILIIKA